MNDSVIVVTPGETIARESGTFSFIRGHGTYTVTNTLRATQLGPGISNPEDDDDDQVEEVSLVASVGGVLERVNKLVTAKPIHTRYHGEIGDLVVGRIVEVGEKRWKVDVGSTQHAALLLSSVTLPGGVLRRRTHEDQLQMRSLFKEQDLVSAEIQQFFSDGSISLHTRSVKYGKLENGQLVRVPPLLIKRLKQHYFTLPCGIEVILGCNGFIWLTEAHAEKAASKSGAVATASRRLATSESIELQRKQRAVKPISPAMREHLSRVSNSIRVLGNWGLMVSDASIMRVYWYSLKLKLAAKELLSPKAMQQVLQYMATPATDT